MNSLITVKEAANFLGVSSKTIRRWENEGRISSMRTVGGHRRFAMTELLSFKDTTECLIVGYVRVVNTNQAEILQQQTQVIKDYCSQKEYKYQIIEDFGNSITSDRPGLKRLIEILCSKKIQSLIIPNTESLGHLYKDLIFRICNLSQIQVVILNQVEETTQEEILEDVREIFKLLKLYLSSLENPHYRELIEYLKAFLDP